MNKKLAKLYEDKWPDLKVEASKIVGVTPAHPLLIKVRGDYEKADVKVMIVGQETDGWNGDFDSSSSKSVDFLMDDYFAYFYDDFKYPYHYVGRMKKKYRRPFWNKSNFNFFSSELKSHFGGKGKKVSCIWNNVSKIGQIHRGRHTDEIEAMEESYFDVFRKEVEILRPNIIIFSSGPTRDRLIKERMGGCDFSKIHSGYTKRQLTKIIFNDFPDICGFRTYHPNYRAGRKARNKALLGSIIKTCG
ncbi:MAG: hypothetical protein Q9O24_07335 [Gammaproteobacteria bacterium]|nr:hypothetical protein [Gammaproteobacteria bacterium]